MSKVTITRPMKAPSASITNEELQKIQYPCLVSPKIDGIRAICTGTQVLSNSLKPIGNIWIQKCLTGPDYEGLDGEIVVGPPFNENEEDDVFNRTTGAVRRKEGEPDFSYLVFDDWRFPNEPYSVRWMNQVKTCEEIHDIPYIEVLEQRLCHSPGEVLATELEFLEKGYEGAMVRRLSAPYKEGRATLREEFIFKRKPVEDDEAIIIGCYEQMENQNEKVTNELGTSTRSSHKENKFGKDTLGGFVLASPKWKDTFNCGTIKKPTPTTDMIKWRKDMWEIADSLIGKIVTYKYQKIGTLEKPRQPIIKGFRDESDIDIEQLKLLKDAETIASDERNLC